MTLFLINMSLSCTFAQNIIVKTYKSDSSDFELTVYSDGGFKYERFENKDSDIEFVSNTIIKIENGDTLWLSVGNDIVGVENLYTGYWQIKNDTMIFIDTTWSQENLNWKICFAKVIDDFTLLNINFPRNKSLCTFYLCYYYDTANQWSFYGSIKNGIINGIKYKQDENNHITYKKEYENEVFSEHQFFDD